MGSSVLCLWPYNWIDVHTSDFPVVTSFDVVTIESEYVSFVWNILSRIPGMCVVVWLITIRGFGLVTGFIHYDDL
jgi:hypothetical protein